MVGILSLTLLAGAAAAVPCESLTSMSTKEVAITAAAVVPAGVFTPPARGGGDGGQRGDGGRRGAAPQGAAQGQGAAPAQGGQAQAGTPAAGGRRGGRQGAPPQPIPEHCRVTMVLKPTSDSNINAELWLPVENWNGKFLAVGNGGFGGAIQGYGDMQVALRAGYATAGNDTGHSAADGPGGMFALGHPEKIVDFAYRAMHEMTATSKKAIDRFYGRAPQFSYYKGCSTGGRQGVMAAQRYPDDFDGIIAGALANRHIQMHTSGVYRSIEVTRKPELALSQEKAALVNNLVMNTCDTLKEGFLNNPRACKVDFSKLACSGTADEPTCLTKGQMQSVETFYGGVKNSKGELIFSGQALGNPIGQRRPLAENATPGGGYDTVRIWGFQNENYDWRTFDLDRDMPLINKRVGFVDAVDPDLRRFKARGGKLLLYAGWGDTTITPENTVLYYDSVLEKMGKDQGNWMRLFLVPGMAHCGGGPGPNSIDTLGTLEQWREKGLTPSQIMGSNAAAGMTRPVCSYPQYANYTGTGDLKDAANWSCRAP
jgi:feruloyl esterase